jgi:hypothetical protein
VLHGDLTGGNVLLTASDKDTRGFTAKARLVAPASVFRSLPFY